MNKETILYIGGFELPDKNAAAHRVLNNAKILKDLGYNIVFIDINKDINSYGNLDYIKKDVHGFECWSVPYPKRKVEWIKYLTSIDHIKRIVSKYKNIKYMIVYNYQAISLLKLKVYCKHKNIKLLGDCTEWYDAKGIGFVFYIIKSLDSYIRMKILHPKLDGLIVISEYLNNFYRKNGVENIVTIPPLVDINEDKWEKNIKENDDDVIKFVYAGNPGKYKDKLNYIIEAFSELDYEKFFVEIVGINIEEYLDMYPEHKNILKKLNNKIKFTGRVSHKCAIDKVKRSDFIIFVRDINRVTMAGFPTKFVESISCGTPVITNMSSDLSKFLVHGENGFFINNNFKQEIKDILEIDRIDLKLMKRNVIRDTFDYRHFKHELEQIL